MKSRYILDKDFNLKKVTHTVTGVLWTCVKWFIATASLAAFYYLIFSFVINTDEERRLKRENRMYARLYPEMAGKEKLVSDVVKDLQLRDGAIYRQIFNAEAPSVDPQNSTMFVFADDSVQDRDIVEYTARKSAALTGIVDSVGSDFNRLFADMSGGSRVMPPMRIPVDGLKFAQVGASCGQKMHPF